MLYGIFISLIVLTSIDVFFSFTAELKYLNQGTYDIATLSKYILLNLPKSITIMFPYAMLIGAMLSLGTMASDYEFVAMQSAGISISKIISFILIQSFLVSVVFYTLSDQLIPQYSSKAENKKNIALNKKIIFQRNGIWFKDKQSFIRINEIYSQNTLKVITKYDYNKNNELTTIHRIKEAINDGKNWILRGVEEINISKIPVTKKIHDETSIGVDVAIVATSSLHAFQDALKLVRKGGTVVMFGVPSKGATTEIDMSLVYSKEISIVTTYAASDVDTKDALELISSGKVDVKSLITHKYSLEESQKAFEHAKTGDNAMKIIIEN